MKRFTMKKSEKFFYIAAPILWVLGLLFTRVYTPMRFSGQLCFCAAGVSLVLGFLTRWAAAHPWARWARRVLAVLLAAGFTFFAALEVWVISCSRTDRNTEVSAMVVLGAGVHGAVPSMSLSVRLEAALAYAEDRPDIPIVVSGGQGGGEDIAEARCMADWLMARGVPEERIWLEDQSTNTEENVAFSKALLTARGVDVTDHIAIVTADYHLCRALRLWGGDGAVPVAAHMPPLYWPLTVNYYIREAFAMAAELLLS